VITKDMNLELPILTACALMGIFGMRIVETQALMVRVGFTRMAETFHARSAAQKNTEDITQTMCQFGTERMNDVAEYC
jgi:hypothetical protein